MQSLFQPVTIGSLKLKNRIVMAPMATNFSGENGSLTEIQIAYYQERAAGGVGLIVTESNYVSLEGRGSLKRLGFISDQQIEEHRKLTDNIHQAGSAVCAQLHHAGSTAPAAAIGQIPVSCSSVPLWGKKTGFVGAIPQTLTIADIEELIKCFGAAAKRAVAAGFDAVQVHSAHGYLINQFLSPRTNKRRDRYGGSDANRLRFLLEVVNEVRKNVGPDFPIFCRLSAEEEYINGYNFEFIREAAKELENHGINEINISNGNYEQLEKLVPSPPMALGYNKHYAKALKDSVSVPVGVVGRINNPVLAADIIENGYADLVYLGRALIAEPRWPEKARRGEAEKIRPCIYCDYGCFERMLNGQEIRCSVNSEVGNQPLPELKSPDKATKVAVIGGGPAGLEVARIFSCLGHTVTIYEKEKTLGGKLLAASRPPHKEEIIALAQYMAAALDNEKVTINLGVKMDGKQLAQLDVDAVFMATGAEVIVPNIKGVDMVHVYTAETILFNENIQGKRAVVIGGGLVGCETALYLHQLGNEVEIVEKLDDVLNDVPTVPRKLLLTTLAEKGIKVHLNTEVKEFKESAVVVRKFDSDMEIPAQACVVCVGYKTTNDLLKELETKTTKQLFVVGDAAKPRKIYDAVQEARQKCCEFLSGR